MLFKIVVGLTLLTGLVVLGAFLGALVGIMTGLCMSIAWYGTFVLIGLLILTAGVRKMGG